MAESRTEAQLLAFLRGRGATGLLEVRLRRNRSTLWSVTKGGRCLNLQRTYAEAPVSLLEHFATILRAGRRDSAARRSSVASLGSWSPVLADVRRLRGEASRSGPTETGRGVGSCCGSSDQRIYLERLYRYLNRTRFDGRLPADLPLRFSNRMRTRLGQMMPGEVEGQRRVLEIALNVDLLLAGNDRILIETLVHEMAHAADWLIDGGTGHGASWRRWAERVGCEPRACSEARLRRRGRERVTRVPDLPRGWGSED